ncbi:kinesin family member 3a [Dunaliella salina]|uniref:Kinesin family member 3a n=1 Tax=Dunaliella salina TaxID=3046 RepID=A0ABQ7GPF5_DUNSA|nr:kinesin family member 3a [Dunaliella salina]|eukprot:KAF5836468.1 kinesin family member 3a [Dunaliella salina]
MSAKGLESQKGSEAVRVVVRCRPLNAKEKNDGRKRIVDMDVDAGQVKVSNPKGDDHEPPKTFTFDQVYDWNCSQTEIFDVTARPIVDSCMEGYNGTIFAYGQTGTGKSHTMEGKEEPPELRGIIPNTFDYIFSRIGRESSKEYLVRASYLEIYNEDIRDLLSKNPNTKLEMKENADKGVYIKDLMQFVVKSREEITSVLEVGRKNRSVGATQMNQDSSRSHSIFTITIEVTEKLDAAAAAQAASSGT